MTVEAIPGQEKDLSKGGNLQQVGTRGSENGILGRIEMVGGRQGMSCHRGYSQVMLKTILFNGLECERANVK